MTQIIDYEKLRSVYGRLLGLSYSLPVPKGSHFGKIIADDFNCIVDELSNLTGENLDKFKIPKSEYYSFAGSSKILVPGACATKISQLISFLRYKYNLDEKILEIGGLINAIENKELKERCLDLLSARGKFDRPINQATLVLEDTIRDKSGLSDLEGVNLINQAFKENPADSILIIEGIEGEPEEHQGFAHICRGIMLNFRNLTHHKLADKFSREDALKVCGFIDVLLKLLDSAKKNK